MKLISTSAPNASFFSTDKLSQQLKPFNSQIPCPERPTWLEQRKYYVVNQIH
ncbi:hypothetical protein UPYG_G00065720 [Umbra pygmaea]|uniref:Uncharacterized protein n=1 Tax=Umbra pygmaea TaxID=75934 RepID=A0ABD0XAX6_UMBPY